MPEVLTSRPVLAEKPVLNGVQIAVEAMPEGHLLQIMGVASHAEMRTLLYPAGPELGDIRPAGYRQWYVAGDRQLTAATVREITAAMPTGVYLSDQSHGRVRIRVSGARAVELLAKGAAGDLHATAFPVGHATATLFGHISVHLARIGDTQFELTVLRSFAETLYEELEKFARSISAENRMT